MTAEDNRIPRADTPSTARMYDYFLDGKDNYQCDVNAAHEVLDVFPQVRTAAKVNRSFMCRSTSVLASAGLRQFLDIGTGIPTEPNLHQTAQTIAPDSRVVYVDHDPVVLAHAAALMTSTPEGRTAFVDSDLRDPGLLDHPDLLATLDLALPVAVSFCAVLHFIDDNDEALEVVSTLIDALPSGSTLTISHATGHFDPETMDNVVQIYRNNGMPCRVRTYDEFSRLFDGLELLEPGITTPHRWHPPIEPPASHDAAVGFYAAVARKP